MSQLDKRFCYRVSVGFKDMDMSGGDAVDGPRWTGKWLDEIATVHVVAQTPTLAEAGALALFYEHQKAAVKTTEQVCQVHAVVAATTK